MVLLIQGGLLALMQPRLEAQTAAAQVNVAANSASPGTPVRRPAPMSPHARDYYQLLWGITDLDVKAVESGQMIRFSYSVVDATKAALLNDKKVNPLLLDENTHVQLIVPTMEKVGQLRQTAPPAAGNAYWMVFSNKGGVVKPGDRVSIKIGKFRADGLYVR